MVANITYARTCLLHHVVNIKSSIVDASMHNHRTVGAMWAIWPFLSGFSEIVRGYRVGFAHWLQDGV